MIQEFYNEEADYEEFLAAGGAFVVTTTDHRGAGYIVAIAPCSIAPGPPRAVVTRPFERSAATTWAR